jgi:ectoine hydroxylase-related dioxygenase (phytanoyl-CoA dioxygenase family)
MRVIELLWKSLKVKNNGVPAAVKDSAASTDNEVTIGDEPPWFDREDASRKLKKEGIADFVLRAKILEFLDRGVAIVEHAVDTELCDKAVHEFNSWKARNRDALTRFRETDGRLMRIINLHQTLPILKSLFCRNRSLPIQDYLFRQETALYTSLFYEQGSAQPIHRDTPLFWTYPGNMYFGMWIALEDTDDENGPLEVIPGGHRIGVIDRAGMAARRFTNLEQVPPVSNELWLDYQEEVLKRCTSRNLKKEKIFVKKGDVILWHPLAPHGGATIKDHSRTRLSFVVHTTPNGVPVFHQDVFFNPSRRVQKTPRWSYSDFEGRAIAETGPMTIGLGIEYDFSQLQ